MVSGPKPGRKAFVGLHMLKDARAAGLNDQTDLFKWAAVPKRLQYPMFPDGRVDDETSLHTTGSLGWQRASAIK